MFNKKPTPPSFLGTDTSNEQAKRIPFLTLGLPVVKVEQIKEIRTAVLVVRDISGVQVSKR